MTRPERLDASRSDVIENNSDIIGELLEDMKNHHKQEKDFSCAIACQEFVVKSLTDHELEESELRDKDEKYGYTDTGGTPFVQAGKVTEEYGLRSEFHNSIFGDSLTLDTAMEKIKNNEKIIAAVDTSMLYYPNSSSSPFLIPQPNHAVEIIGFDKSDPNDVKVIINDPGFEDGAGIMYSWDTFNHVLDGETKDSAKALYYAMILESREALITKIIDRCHNVSSMAGTFSKEKPTVTLDSKSNKC